MGMCLAYCRISQINAGIVLKNPELIHVFLGHEAEEAAQPGFWKNLFGGKKETSSETPVLAPRNEEDEEDADKAWNAIHYILTGTAEGGAFPAGFILYGGKEVGEEDVGYGPARLLSTDELKEVSFILGTFSESSIRFSYDGRAMDNSNAYPQIWERDGVEGFEYVWENFEKLRDFISDTHRRNDCLLIYFC